MDYGLESWGSISGRHPDWLWGPPPIQWALRAVSLGVKQPGCEADHSPQPSAEVMNIINDGVILPLGRAVAQAVSRWLSTAAAQVCVRAACGVCGEQSGTGAGFLRVLRYPLPIISPIPPSS
jgi:hypothetical protein